MISSEIWKRWEPVKGLIPKYDLEFISHDLDKNLIVILKDVDHGIKIKIIFKDIACYQKNFISDRLDTYYTLNKEYGIDFYKKWSFFKIENSQFIKSLTSNINRNLNHFCILSSEFVIDIIAIHDPKVEIMQE